MCNGSETHLLTPVKWRAETLKHSLIVLPNGKLMSTVISNHVKVSPGSPLLASQLKDWNSEALFNSNPQWKTDEYGVKWTCKGDISGRGKLSYSITEKGKLLHTPLLNNQLPAARDSAEGLFQDRSYFLQSIGDALKRRDSNHPYMSDW